MAAVWLITTVLTSLRYFHISEASWYHAALFLFARRKPSVTNKDLAHTRSVSFTLSALTPPLFILVYVSALQADSIDLRKKGTASGAWRNIP